MSKSSVPPTKKKIADDANFELEQQFILRMPQEVSDTLREEVITGSPVLSHNISIEMLPDGRRALIRYGQFIYNAKLVDLPCILESLKTIDKKSFYKTADISQMLVCTEEEDQEDADMLKKKEREKKYTWNHGVTPPLKNVRKRRFRKTLTKKYNDQPDIENEVRQLFRMDAEAIDVKWELIAEDSQVGQSMSEDASQSMAANESTGISDNLIGLGGRQPNLADIDLFGELSSSDDEKDLNILDSGDDDSNRTSVLSTPFSTEVTTVDSGQSMMDTQNSEILKEQLEKVKSELDIIRNQIMEQEIQMATIDNPALQQHFQDLMDKLVDQETAKDQEYQNLLRASERAQRNSSGF